MHRFVLIAAIGVCALAGGSISSHVLAQAGPFNAQRDCQTIRTCNFGRGGTYRGCLSSYSCRRCHFERVACNGLGGGTCQKLRCTWG
jgi:hypothetical protein